MTPREALYHLSMALGPVAHTNRDDNLSYNESTVRDAMTTLQTWVDADVLPSAEMFMHIAEPNDVANTAYDDPDTVVANTPYDDLYRNAYNPEVHVEEHVTRPYNSIEPPTIEVHDPLVQFWMHTADNSIEPPHSEALTPVQVSRLELDDLDRYLHSMEDFLPSETADEMDGTAGSDSIYPITDALPMYGLIENIIEWHYDRNLIHGSTDKDQFCKLIQECGELSSEMCVGGDIRDDIGDIMVVLINIAERNNVSLADCLNVAYDDIKDRKGLMIDGVFVKYEI